MTLLLQETIKQSGKKTKLSLDSLLAVISNVQPSRNLITEALNPENRKRCHAYSPTKTHWIINTLGIVFKKNFEGPLKRVLYSSLVLLNGVLQLK